LRVPSNQTPIMSYTNQDDYATGLTNPGQNKPGAQNFSSLDKNDTLGSAAATRSYGGPDELSDTTYSSNGNRFNDESNPDKDRLDNRTSRRDDADELSDPSYSSNANRFDNSRSTVSGGAHFGSSGDPNTFSTSNNDVANRSGDRNTSTGNTYGSGNQQSDGNNDRDLNTSTGNTYGSGNQQSGDYTSGTGNRGYGTADDDSGLGSTGSLGSGGATRRDVNPTVSSGNYGVSGVGSSAKRYDDDNADPDADVGGAGTGYGSQRRTTATSDRRGDNAYGNDSSDRGVAGARTDGGANDPARTRYSYGQGGNVGDADTTNVGSYNNDVGGAGQGHQGRVGMGEKIKGSLEKVQGKLTRKPDLVQQGEARKTGNLNDDNQYGSSGNDEYGSNTGGGRGGDQAYGQRDTTDY